MPERGRPTGTPDWYDVTTVSQRFMGVAMTGPAESAESVEQLTGVWRAMVLDRDPGADVRDRPGIAVRWADCGFARLAARRREVLPVLATSSRPRLREALPAPATSSRLR